MGYYKSLRLTFFFPTLAISVGVVWGLTRYSTNVTMVNNDQREIKWLPVSKDLRKQIQPQAIFLVTEPLVQQKRHNEWVKRVNHVIVIYTV